MKRKDAAPLSSILEAFLESLRIPHVAFLVSLRKRWREIAGPLVSRNAMPLSLERHPHDRRAEPRVGAGTPDEQDDDDREDPGNGRRKSSGERYPVHRGIPRFGRGGGRPAARGAPVHRRSRSGGLSAVADPETRESLRALHRRSTPPKEIPSKSQRGKSTSYPVRKRRQIRSHLKRISLLSFVKDQGREETGSSASAPYHAAGRRHGGAPSRGCTTRTNSTRNPSFAAHGLISERRGYGKMKANRPDAENGTPPRRAPGARRSPRAAPSPSPDPGLTPVSRPPYGGFDTTRSNEPGSIPEFPPKIPGHGRTAVRPGNCRGNSGARNRAGFLEFHTGTGKHNGDKAGQE